jgi:hypothetical protein
MNLTYLATSSDRARGLATSVLRVFAFVMLGCVGRGEDTRPNITPSAIVERFLLQVPTCQIDSAHFENRSYLAPKNIRIRIRVKVGSDLGNS